MKESDTSKIFLFFWRHHGLPFTNTKSSYDSWHFAHHGNCFWFCKLFYEDKTKSEIEFHNLKQICEYAFDSGIEVHLGHGLDYETTKKITEIQCIQEVNIGFFLIAQSIFDGLENSIRRMKEICDKKV